MTELQAEFHELNESLSQDIAALEARLDPSTLTLETIEIPPRKSDIGVDSVLLAWIPVAIGQDGSETSLLERS